MAMNADYKQCRCLFLSLSYFFIAKIFNQIAFSDKKIISKFHFMSMGPLKILHTGPSKTVGWCLPAIGWLKGFLQSPPCCHAMPFLKPFVQLVVCAHKNPFPLVFFSFFVVIIDSDLCFFFVFTISAVHFAGNICTGTRVQWLQCYRERRFSPCVALQQQQQQSHAADVRSRTRHCTYGRLMTMMMTGRSGWGSEGGWMPLSRRRFLRRVPCCVTCGCKCKK